MKKKAQQNIGKHCAVVSCIQKNKKMQMHWISIPNLLL